MSFNELIHLLERNGFRFLKEKGSIRYYHKSGIKNLKAAGLKGKPND